MTAGGSGEGGEAGEAGEVGVLAGQVAVITGGAGGIGSATAAALAGSGATVVVLDRSPRREPGSPARLAITTDVTDPDSLRAAAQAVKREFGGCDMLVIAAGVAVTGAAGRATEADWDLVFGVNVRGAWLTFREFQPVLRLAG